MAAKPPDAFLSYTRFDDQNDGGRISEFCRRLAGAVRAVTGVPFDIFQDVEGIGIGEHWPGKLDDMLDETRFFIPILTPSYFTSQPCRDELTKFLRVEADRGRNDLVLPIYYIECDRLEEENLRAADPLATAIHERQRQDWRELRFDSFETSDVRRAVERLARKIASSAARPSDEFAKQPADEVTSNMQDQATKPSRESNRQHNRSEFSAKSGSKLALVSLTSIVIVVVVALSIISYSEKSKQPMTLPPSAQPTTSHQQAATEPANPPPTAPGPITNQQQPPAERIGQRMPAQDITGTKVVNNKGEQIGEVEHLVIDKDQVEYAVISVGGFLGIGEKHVVVPLDQFKPGKGQTYLSLAKTEDQLKTMPEYQKDKYSLIQR